MFYKMDGYYNSENELQDKFIFDHVIIDIGLTWFLYKLGFMIVCLVMIISQRASSKHATIPSRRTQG